MTKRYFKKGLHIKDQKGSLLASILIIAFVLVSIGLAILQFTTDQLVRSQNTTFSANAVLVAEAGVERSLYELNLDDDFAGYASEQEFFNDAQQGRGTYMVEVEDSADTNSKIITATSKVYHYNQSTNPISTRKVKVTVVGTGSDGYAVHTGPGGLILGGSASINNSDVYVNGTITMTGAARIGTNANPADVYAANIRCPATNPPGATYPQLCSTGQQPISLQWSTYIYGTVCATHQTSTGPNPSGNILPGSGGQGLVPGCVAPGADPPSYNQAAHKADISVSGAGNSNTYVCNSWPFDRNWPAKLRLTGNTNVGGSCNVTINGNVYITGNFDLGGAATIRVPESVGTNRPVVIVDGNITIGGSARVIPNSQGTGIQFISFRSTAPCNPNCTSLSGNNLYNSQNTTTVNVGGAVNMPGVIYQAYWGRIVLGGSGNVGSAIGQVVDMSGAGSVTFGTALSSGERTWTVTSYQQVFD